MSQRYTGVTICRPLQQGSCTGWSGLRESVQTDHSRDDLPADHCQVGIRQETRPFGAEHPSGLFYWPARLVARPASAGTPAFAARLRRAHSGKSPGGLSGLMSLMQPVRFRLPPSRTGRYGGQARDEVDAMAEDLKDTIKQNAGGPGRPRPTA